MRAIAVLLIALVAGPALAAPTAVATFESLGMYWNPSGAAANKVASVRYREGTGAWRTGYPLWFDGRDSQYRGSIVGLTPGSTYEVELSLPGGPTETVTATTWSEVFPIAQTIELPANSSQTLAITQSGTPSGYILYTGAPNRPATIDVGSAADECITINANYVIVRGLILKNARIHGVLLNGASHDVVLEENDISGWGRIASDGWGIDYDGGVFSNSVNLERIIVQRNRIHHPRSDSNDWGEYRALNGTAHPEGPQAVAFFDSAGNHVIRYNDIYTDDTHRFNDCLGAGDNYSTAGFPNRDSDIYGNHISHCWDDGIESEGANRNVRIWGNLIEDTLVKVATATTSVGPLYVFRNVAGVARQNDREAPDVVEHGGFLKTNDAMGGGKIFVFHNTILQPPPPAGSTYPLGCDPGLGHGGPMLNVMSRNNILHIHKNWHTSIDDNNQDPLGDYDFDLYNGVIVAAAGAEANGMVGVPTYAAANGLGEYGLDPSSLGFDDGAVLPNFNDGFAGTAPDVGAFEAGSPAMQFGVDAYRTPSTSSWGAPISINAGGPASPPFVADIGFVGGTPFVNWSGAIDLNGVASPAPEDVYQSERYGNSTYTIPGLTPGQDYLVRLHFCENFRSAAGQRLFDVTLDGTLVLDDFDVFAAAGAQHRGVVREFTVTSGGSGELTIALTTVVDQALINGIEVLRKESLCDPCGPPGEIYVDPASCSCGAGAASTADNLAFAGCLLGFARWRRRRLMAK